MRRDVALQAILIERELRRSVVLPICRKEPLKSVLSRPKFSLCNRQPTLDELALGARLNLPCVLIERVDCLDDGRGDAK